jgi:hypothetical protein
MSKATPLTAKITPVTAEDIVNLSKIWIESQDGGRSGPEHGAVSALAGWRDSLPSPHDRDAVPAKLCPNVPGHE